MQKAISYVCDQAVKMFCERILRGWSASTDTLVNLLDNTSDVNNKLILVRERGVL